MGNRQIILQHLRIYLDLGDLQKFLIHLGWHVSPFQRNKQTLDCLLNKLPGFMLTPKIYKQLFISYFMDKDEWWLVGIVVFFLKDFFSSPVANQ